MQVRDIKWIKSQANIIEEATLYLTLGAGFAGPAILLVDLVYFSLFPYRFLLIGLWGLFLIRIFLRGGRITLSHIRVRFEIAFLSLWLAYALLSVLWSHDTLSAIKHIIFLMSNFSVIFFMVYYLSQKNDLIKLNFLWLGGLLVLLGVAIWEHLTGQHLNISELYGVETRWPTSVFYNSNDFATYLVLSFPFCLSLIRYTKGLGKFLGVLLGGVSIYFIVILSSRANYLAVLLQLLFLMFLLDFRGRLRATVAIWSFIFLISILLPDFIGDLNKHVQKQLASLTPTELSVQTRLNLLQNGLIFLVQHGLLGVGAGNIEYHMANFAIYPTYGILNLHNWWLEVLVDYGLFIFFGYLVFYISLLRGLLIFYRTAPGFRPIIEPVLLAIVGSSIAVIAPSSVMALAPIWILFGIALVLVNRYWLEKSERSDGR
jgi:teichuronic acid biosynthesis protein TuaE